MPLPDIGRWVRVSYKSSKLETKAEILSHREISRGDFSGFQNKMARCAEIRFEDGTLDSMEEAIFTTCEWSYIDAPSREELRAAEDKS